MLKFINIKKLTAHTLVGILLAASLVTESSTKKAIAGSCDNNGIGNNHPVTFSLPSGNITINKIDPDNSSKMNSLEANLSAGIFSGTDHDVVFTGSSLTSDEITYILDNIPDWEKNSNKSNCSQSIADYDSDGDGISDADEGTDDSDFDGIADFLDDTDDRYTYSDSSIAPIVANPSTPLPTRTLVNPSFEFPAYSGGGDWKSLDNYIPGDDTSLQGWFSTHPTTGYSGYGDSRFRDADGNPFQHLIELWVNNFQGVPAPEGSQFAELNAQADSALYQDVCVMANEQVRWTASHRGRSHGNTADVAEVFISDPNDWTGVTYSGSKLYSAYIATSNDGSPSSISTNTGSAGQATKTDLSNGWRKYSDVWTGPSTSQKYRFAFQSVSSANGNVTYGNFLDDIQLELSPTVEFVETDEISEVNLPSVEGDVYYLTLRVNGNLLSQGTVDLTLANSSTLTGDDFTLGSLVAGDGGSVISGVNATKLSDGRIRLTLPSGSYDRNNVIDYITIPLNFSGFSGIKTATFELKDQNMFGGGDGNILNLITANGSGDCASITEHSLSIKLAQDVVATDDSVETYINQNPTIDVLSNDTDGDGVSLNSSDVTITVDDSGASGTASVSNDQIVYTPGNNFLGNDSFTYTITNTDGATDSATVSVTVNNRQPIANDDDIETYMNTAVTFNVVTNNDTDPDGNTLNINSVTQPSHGTVTFSGQEVTYTPTTNYVGLDSFTYTISDGYGATDTATVSVTVKYMAD